MSQPERSSRMAVLLFTDMVGSVAMQERLGTESYARLLQEHHRLLSQALEAAHDGKIRNDTGDGVLCEFSTAAAAVEGALLFQMLIREAKWAHEAPQVRIGIHQGQLAEFQMDGATPGKLVGMPVNIASRVMGLAQGGQILMTSPVYDDARHFVREHPIAPQGRERPPALRWVSHGTYTFKGSEKPIEVFEVGAVGFAPLTPPPSTDKARSATVPRPTPLPPPSQRKHSPLIGAGLAVLTGMILWLTLLGEPWVNASYDNLFRFGTRAVTNQVAVILLDNEAFGELKQSRDQPWDRSLHVSLLNKLADDKCPLVGMDIYFGKPGVPEVDNALAAAMARLSHIVLAAEHSSVTHPGVESLSPRLPLESFLAAAGTDNWGVAWLDPDLDLIVRRHWPFPSPGPHPSLPWKMAELSGVRFGGTAEARWLRYYDLTRTWIDLSFHMALAKGPNYFHDKVVLIGSKPRTPLPDNERDEFRSPHFNWTGETVGGVEVLATMYLNLMNQEWLCRPPWLLEAMIYLVAGSALGWGLCKFRRSAALAGAAGFALVFTTASVCLSYFTNSWFPWLVVVGGQLPVALAWALFAPQQRISVFAPSEANQPTPKPAPDQAVRLPPPNEQLPDAPEFEIITPAIGQGGFGKVWIVRNALGQWQALKAVYQSKFGDKRGPYEAEFRGLQRYKPVSEKHPGLLRIELVSRMKATGYFYYVMELGDAQFPGWENQPALYKPKDLEHLRKQAYKRRLPPKECLRIVTVLADALNFLHSQGLTHRDIKPSNVIFVNGRPKLADVGLVADIRPPDQVHTFVGTLGYMPPPPEVPGTPQADIFSLGMLLYVISTGREPDSFPSISTSLMESSPQAEFARLNAIILKATQPNLSERYQKTSEMLNDLRAVGERLDL